MADDLQLLNRALAGRYHLADEIGRGGMATVYRARDIKHDRPVALKVLKPHLSATLGAERFLREIAVTARLDHAHILPLLDSGEAEGLLYYVMPYVDGESLRDRLDREKQLSLDDALRIAREVADALSYAHSHDIVHRDIKPENILLSGRHARIADFGIARAVKAAGADSSLTETGLAIGTPTYMSPEQASGEREVDARTDVYSLGCVLYEMLSGQPPYTGINPEAIMARKILGPLPSLRIVRDTIPSYVEAAVTKALAKVPADRFASASEFAHALHDDRAAATTESPASRISRSWRIGVPVFALAAALLFILAKMGDRRVSPAGDTGRPRIASLAVLPLENLSADADQDYFAAGIHEALIVHLGKMSGLERVIARPSVMRFGKSDRSPRQIADELGVSALITGTVLRSGNKIRVTAQLIDPNTERQLWGESYEREIRDVFALQNEIVAAIAREVQLKLSSGDRATLARTRRVNPQAYEAYLKGKFHLNRFTPEGFAKGMALFDQAIAIDPSEPLAYAGLAYGYSLMEVLAESSSPDASQRAKAAGLKAVELDPALAEAHDALSGVRMAEFDYDGARQSMERALELNPNLAEARVHHAWNLAIFGTEAEAIAEMKRGIELDPLSPLYNAWLGGLYWEYGRFDEAVAQAQKSMDLEPDFPVALYVLGLALADKGQYAEAIAANRKGMQKYPNRNFAWGLARTYAVAGKAEDARKILSTAESDHPIEPVHPWFIAAAYGALGDYENAMQWLEKAYDTRSLFLPNLKRDRSAGFDLRPMRKHPRFNSLLRRTNLL
jgi:eukaryotic-like serine/threonine-protein kinase